MRNSSQVSDKRVYSRMWITSECGATREQNHPWCASACMNTSDRNTPDRDPLFAPTNKYARTVLQTRQKVLRWPTSLEIARQSGTGTYLPGGVASLYSALVSTKSCIASWYAGIVNS
jgi:hypothetical protein